MAELTPTNRYSSACFTLQLKGNPMGFLHTVEGGEPIGHVIPEAVDANGVVKKRLGSVGYNPIVMTFGIGMDAAVYQWISDTLARKAASQDGAIIVGDYNFKERYRLEFHQATITSIGFPPVDVSSTDAAWITLTLQPEYVRVNAASLGTPILGFAPKTQKKWKASNFRLKVSGLETACAKANAVDALTVTQDVVSDATGELRDVVLAKRTLNVPDLSFSVAESAAPPILAWVEDFLTQGNSGQGNEKTGTLEFLDASLYNVLFTLSFSNLGVFSIRRLRAEEKSSVIARVAVYLYCEQMTFVAGEDAIGSNVAPSQSSAGSAQSTTTNGDGSTLTDTLLDIVAGRLTPEMALQTALKVPIVAQSSTSSDGVLSQTVARRLLTTIRPLSLAPTTPKWDDGVALGQQWATTVATIDELNEIKTINQTDWSALNLEPGHTLVEKLRGQGLVPDGVDGPMQLERDAFVEGIVAGALQVLNNATPHLTPVLQTPALQVT